MNRGKLWVVALFLGLMGWTAGCDDTPTVEPDAQCLPQCGGQECGGDGCGGLCGLCDDGICNEGSCINVCIIDCAGKECGNDGCGGSCGECVDGGVCADAAGICMKCTPECTDKECGDNGCGGSCGTCFDATCEAGVCEPLCVPECTGIECGDDGCGGSCGDCAVGELCASGACATCTPDCFGKDCGDDGCGGDCGACDPGEACNIETCEPCTADCTDADCGSDGCGGTCGDCGEGDSCKAGVCEACTPNCVEKNCGSDGCGGTCGACAGGGTCNEGICVTDGCTPKCPDKDCGSDGCGGICGICSGGDSCFSGHCASTCTADCAGKSCGSDGCGGTCGTCSGGKSCDAGTCVEGCVPDCAGKECGLDGCGGICAACPFAEFCYGGECTTFCVPKCEDKECGGDSCGGTCGPCGAGDYCIASACVEGEGTDTCAEFRACANECKPTSGACFTECVENTSGDGLEDAKAYAACITEHCSDLPTTGELYACLAEYCDDETGLCASNWSDGTGNCASFKECADPCETNACYFACTEEANPAVWGYLFDTWYCSTNAIIDKICPPGAYDCIANHCDDALALCVGESACTPDCSEATCGPDGCGGSCGACTGGPLGGACVSGVCALSIGFGVTGCGTLLGCVDLCVFGDETCVTTCAFLATAEGIEDASAYQECREFTCAGTSSNQEKHICLDENCASEIAACEANWPSGDDDCSASNLCWNACGSDEGCKADCAEDADPEAWGLLLDVKQCFASVISLDICASGDSSCIFDYCGALAEECTATSACVPKCAGVSCGDDGCGGTCGTCGTGTVCIEGEDGGCVGGSGDEDCLEYRQCAAGCPTGNATCKNLCALQASPGALTDFNAYTKCVDVDCAAMAATGDAGLFTCMDATCPDIAAKCVLAYPSGTANCETTLTCFTECVEDGCGADCRIAASPSGWGLSSDYFGCIYDTADANLCGGVDIPCLMDACGAVFAACQAD